MCQGNRKVTTPSRHTDIAFHHFPESHWFSLSGHQSGQRQFLLSLVAIWGVQQTPLLDPGGGTDVEVLIFSSAKTCKCLALVSLNKWLD